MMACPPCDQREKELLARCVAVDKASSYAEAAFVWRGPFSADRVTLKVLSDCLIGFVADWLADVATSDVRPAGHDVGIGKR